MYLLNSRPSKAPETANSNYLPDRDMNVPNPRGGEKSKSSLSFILDHSIMDQAVPAYFGGRPLYNRANVE